VVSALVGLGVLATLPDWGTSSNLATVVEIMTLLALAQMWNLLAGFAGLVSIGQQAFIGIGAYALLVLADDHGIDPFVAVWLAALVAALLSVPIGVLAFRLRGGYFAIGTWVIAQVVFLMVTNNTSLGGGNGRSLLSLGAYDRITREDYTFYTALVVGAGAVAVVVLILRSRLGLASRRRRTQRRLPARAARPRPPRRISTPISRRLPRKLPSGRPPWPAVRRRRWCRGSSERVRSTLRTLVPAGDDERARARGLTRPAGPPS